MSFENPNQKEIVEKDLVAKTTEIVPAGQEWRIKQLLKSEIVVKAGAKLVVTELAAKNKITVEDGGELEITGEDLKNEIIKSGEGAKSEPEPERAPEEKSEKSEAPSAEGYDEKMLEASRKEIEHILGMKEETFTKMQKMLDATLFMNSFQDNIRLGLSELASKDFIDKATHEALWKKQMDFLYQLGSSVFNGDERSVETVRGLLTPDETYPKLTKAQALIEIRHLAKSFLETGIVTVTNNSHLDQYQLAVLKQMRKEKGLPEVHYN